MTNLKRFGVGLAAAALLLGLAGLHGAGQADAQTVPDATFTGTVMIDGDAAPNGTAVTAMLEGETCATDMVGGAEGDGKYVLRIPSTCSTQAGQMLSFMVGDMMAAETAPWSNSGLNTVNLTAMSAMPTEAPTEEPTAMATEEPEEPMDPDAMETETPDEPMDPDAMETETAMATDTPDTAMTDGSEGDDVVAAPSDTGTGLASGATSATTTLAAALGALALAVTLGGLALARRRG